MSEIFRIYLEPGMAALMSRAAMRGAWEAAVIEQGATVVPGGVQVAKMGNGKTMVAGRAERPA